MLYYHTIMLSIYIEPTQSNIPGVVPGFRKRDPEGWLYITELAACGHKGMGVRGECACSYPKDKTSNKCPFLVTKNGYNLQHNMYTWIPTFNNYIFITIVLLLGNLYGCNVMKWVGWVSSSGCCNILSTPPNSSLYMVLTLSRKLMWVK